MDSLFGGLATDYPDACPWRNLDVGPGVSEIKKIKMIEFIE